MAVHRPGVLFVGMFVCLLGTAAGMFFGGLSGLLYEADHITAWIGSTVGCITGLAAGAIWTWCMVRLFARTGRLSGIYGTGLGVAVGLGSGLLVHVSLLIASMFRPLGESGDYWFSVPKNFLNWVSNQLLWGLLFGLVVGLIAGFISWVILAFVSAGWTDGGPEPERSEV